MVLISFKTISIRTKKEIQSDAGASPVKEPLIRKCSLIGNRARQILEKAEFDSDFGRQLMAKRLDETHTRHGASKALTTSMSRHCYIREVYFHPGKVIILTDPLYWETLPPDELQREYVYTISFPSHSERAHVIIWDDGSVSEFKGETLPPGHVSCQTIHEQSQEPWGLVESNIGEREAEMLNFVGAIDSRFHLIGQGEDPKGETIRYGQLTREARNFMPWVRLDRSLEDIYALANWEETPFEDFLTSIANRLGTQLRKLHLALHFNLGFRRLPGYFEGIMSYHHLGNIEVHGNLLDLGTVKTLEEIRRLFDEHSNIDSEEEMILFAAFLDIHRIFGGVYPPTSTFLWELDMGLLSRQWSPYYSNLFLESFARAYLGDNTKDLNSFTANWYRPKKLMPIIARNLYES